MRIALSASVIQGGKTGVGQYVFGLVKAFEPYADKHELHVLALEDEICLFDFAKNYVKLVPVCMSFKPPVKNFLWHQCNLPHLLLHGQFDVVHIPSYRRMLVAASCARVTTIHDLAPFSLKNKYDIFRMTFAKHVIPFLARRQERIVAVSITTALDVSRFLGVSCDRLRLIYNGLDHSRFCENVGIASKFDAPFFLCVSRLEHPAKNHVRLIDAFNRFKASTKSNWLLVFGGGDWHGADVIHSAALASPYSSDIRFLGFVSDVELPDLYRTAGAFVYPSLFEGFGFPPLEAMACGCPVICSLAGSLNEVVGNAAGVIDPLNVDSILNGLIQVSTDIAWRDALKCKGKENVRRFRWDNVMKQLLDVYVEASVQFKEQNSTSLSLV